MARAKCALAQENPPLIDMKLNEYLLGKYRRQQSVSISDDEAIVVGIPVPPERGWPEKFGNLEIDLATAKKLMGLMERNLRCSGSARKKQTAQWAIETIRIHFGRDADCLPAARTDSEIRRERKARRRARKKERKLEKRKQFWASRNVVGDSFLESYEWRRVRMAVLKRDGARCVCCGATPSDGVRMNVDHIKPRKKFPELALDPANLQVLCEECNHGKGNWDQTDWRPVEASNDDCIAHIRSIVREV